MPQVAGDIVHQRAARLREAGSAALARALASRIGSTASVLVEGPGFGHSEHFAPVRFTGGIARGDLARLHITGTTADALIGEVAA
jgi:threonylcarbamoyladenosine tRNA methylthiotransferase MtaB